MNIRIGFPVVLKNGMGEAVWVSTANAPGGGKAFWNGQNLALSQPFGSACQSLNDAVQRITESRNLFFSCDGLQPNNAGRIEFAGQSFGIVAYLAEHYDLRESGDHHVLITGQLVDGAVPRPLVDVSSLNRKGEYARNTQCSIFLLRQDYLLLEERNGRFHSADMPEAGIPESVQMLKEWVSHRHRGRAYIMPISDTGKWELTRQDWWLGLGTFLDLSPRSVATPAIGHSIVPTKAQSEGQVLHTVPGTVAQLYFLAASNKTKYLEAFLAQNAELCALPLFEDGLTAQAVVKKDDLFFDLERGIEPFRNILIGGPAGCGKSFLSEALILNDVMALGSGVIYIAPTRELALERFNSLQKRFVLEARPGDIDKDDIVISTGERTENDYRLHKGNFKIAVMVNEKANLFLRPSVDFLQNLGLIIIDELQMISEHNRGGIIDMLIAKSREEMRRRRRTGARPLRMVGITTEGLIEHDAIKAAFCVEDASQTKYSAVSLVSPRRPERVHHVCRVLGRPDATGTAEVYVVKFQAQADRQLPIERCYAISTDLANRMRIIDKTTRRGPWGIIGPRMGEVITDFISEYTTKGYSTMMVAHPSIPGIMDAAARLRKKRHSQGYVKEENAQLRQCVEEGHVGRQLGSTLLEMAGFGIYMHHSELPRKVREAVATHFRRHEKRQDGLCEILFATETLFYGVNLSVDLVILTTPKWTREIPGEPELDAVEITPNELHNVLGRAGRPGYEQATCGAKAVLCFPFKQYFGDDRGLHDAIRRYYGGRAVNPLSGDRISSLFELNDIENNRTGSIGRLDDISHPTFRSVMDALRHRCGMDGRPASAAKVLALIRDTVFFASQPAPSNDIESLVHCVLKAAASENLIEAEDEVYAIKPEAEALIDTGTKWRSVRPMKAWLGILHQLAADYSAVRPFPVELLMPAFVLPADLWYTARTFCWECHEKKVVESSQRINEGATQALLINEFRNLGLPPELSEVVCSRLWSVIGELASDLPLSVPEYRRTVFCRLVVAFLKWLRGVDEEEIDMLSLREPDPKKLLSEGRHFKERYTERASWLSMMSLRYFDKTGILLDEHRRELPRLSQRLRYGVEAAGLPYVGQLSRRDIGALLSKGCSPSQLLMSDTPADLVIGAGVWTPDHSGSAEDIVEGVFRFYRNQIRELVGSLVTNETNEIWQEFGGLMTELTDAQVSVRGPAREQQELLARVLADLLSGQRRLMVTLQHDNTSVLLGGAEDDRLLIRVLGPVESEQPYGRTPEVRVRLPWARVVSSGVDLTACGGMVLADLIGRNFLKSPIQVLRSFVVQNQGLKSIQDLLEFDMPSLSAELRSPLLQFLEPGV